MGDYYGSMAIMIALFANLLAIGIGLDHIRNKKVKKIAQDGHTITQDYYKLQSLYHTLGHLLKAKGSILFTDDTPDINPAIQDVVKRMNKLLEERKYV